jgi:predicted dehydrogenase
MRDGVAHGRGGLWPTSILTPDATPAGVMKALREGPYGRCAYKCDNDVVDNQIVNMQFANGATAQMEMTAFCNERGRQTRIFGTHGSILSDSSIIHLTDFVTNETFDIDTNVSNDGSILSGHGGGDGGLMDMFVSALETGDQTYILSGVDDTLESHLMCFKAEESRRKGIICNVK